VTEPANRLMAHANFRLSNRLSRFEDPSFPARSRPNPRDPAKILETGWRRPASLASDKFIAVSVLAGACNA